MSGGARSPAQALLAPGVLVGLRDRDRDGVARGLDRPSLGAPLMGSFSRTHRIPTPAEVFALWKSEGAMFFHEVAGDLWG
jgi:hypothetical protein